MGARHVPDQTAKGLPIPLPTPSQDVPGFLKAALNVSVADEQVADDPEDLMAETMAQIGLYTHRGLDSQASSNNQGALTPATPSPGRVLEAIGRPEGSA